MMTIAVLTPEREVFNGRIQSVKVPGINGEFQVLNNHAPIVSALANGKIEIVTADGDYTYFDTATKEKKTASGAGNKLTFYVNGGFLEVLNNDIALLVQGLEMQ